MEHTVPALVLAATVWLTTVLGDVVPYVAFGYTDDPFVKFGRGMLGGDGANWLYCTIPSMAMTIVQEGVGVTAILTAMASWLIGLGTVLSREESVDTMVVPEVSSRPLMPRRLLLCSAVLKYSLQLIIFVNRVATCPTVFITGTFDMHAGAASALFLVVALFFATAEPRPDTTVDDSRDKSLFCLTVSIVLAALGKAVYVIGATDIAEPLRNTILLASFLIVITCLIALVAVITGYIHNPCIVPPAVTTGLSITIAIMAVVRFAAETLLTNPFQVADLTELVAMGLFGWAMALTVVSEKDQIFYRFRVQRVNHLWVRFCVVLFAVLLGNTAQLCMFYRNGLHTLGGMVAFTGSSVQLLCIVVSSGRWFWMNNLELDLRISVALSIGAMLGAFASFMTNLTVLGLITFIRCVTAAVILCRVLPPLRWGNREETAVYYALSIEAIQSKMVSFCCVLPLLHSTTRPSVISVWFSLMLALVAVFYMVQQHIPEKTRFASQGSVSLVVESLVPILALFFTVVLTAEYAWHYADTFASMDNNAYRSGSEGVSIVSGSVRDVLGVFAVVLLWPFCLIEDLPECDTSPSEHRWNSESDMEV